jgi:hypothetical protein
LIASKKEKVMEVLVALLPKTSALYILKNAGWYHIPLESAPQKRWPPKVLAFYQGKVFGKKEAYKIRYYGEVSQIDIVPRKELFPDDEQNKHKAERLYYRLQLKAVEERSKPIVSYRPRRIVFIPKYERTGYIFREPVPVHSAATPRLRAGIPAGTCGVGHLRFAPAPRPGRRCSP